jgi:hypothetical protein
VTVNSKSDPLTIYSGVETDFALPALPLIAGAAIIFPSVIYLLKIFKGTAEGCPAIPRNRRTVSIHGMLWGHKGAQFTFLQNFATKPTARNLGAFSLVS